MTFRSVGSVPFRALPVYGSYNPRRATLYTGFENGKARGAELAVAVMMTLCADRTISEGACEGATLYADRTMVREGARRRRR